MKNQTNKDEMARRTVGEVRAQGGRDPVVAVPQGIEILLKKAAVDPEFRQLLLEQRGGVAGVIGLMLDPAEHAMLKAIPDGQLDAIISQTCVPVEQRRVFLGRVAAAMLAAAGGGLTGCEPAAESAGARPDRPEEDNTRTNHAASNGLKAKTGPDRA